MILRRWMMMASQERKVREELEFNGTGVMCVLDNRKFEKINEGWALVGYCYRINAAGVKWVSPIIVTREPEANTLFYHPSKINLYYNTTFEYEGITYYVGQWDYSVPIGAPVSTPAQQPLHFIGNGTIYDSVGESAVIKAGRALLDYYYYKTEV